jgi:multisubunit Na+/H+ antiporter MnhC subunit
MTTVSILGFLLIIIGLWGMLTQKNIIKIIIGFSIIDTGLHLVIVSLGYIRGRTAPIISDAVANLDRVKEFIDPVPSALVLTAIVIGLAVTALMLVYAIKLYRLKGSLNIDDFEESKW